MSISWTLKTLLLAIAVGTNSLPTNFGRRHSLTTGNGAVQGESGKTVFDTRLEEQHSGMGGRAIESCVDGEGGKYVRPRISSASRGIETRKTWGTEWSSSKGVLCPDYQSSRQGCDRCSEFYPNGAVDSPCRMTSSGAASCCPVGVIPRNGSPMPTVYVRATTKTVREGTGIIFQTVFETLTLTTATVTTVTTTVFTTVSPGSPALTGTIAEALPCSSSTWSGSVPTPSLDPSSSNTGDSTSPSSSSVKSTDSTSVASTSSDPATAPAIPTPTGDPPAAASNPERRLSADQIAGIVLGIIFAILFIILAIFLARHFIQRWAGAAAMVSAQQATHSAISVGGNTADSIQPGDYRIVILPAPRPTARPPPATPTRFFASGAMAAGTSAAAVAAAAANEQWSMESEFGGSSIIAVSSPARAAPPPPRIQAMRPYEGETRPTSGVSASAALATTDDGEHGDDYEEEDSDYLPPPVPLLSRDDEPSSGNGEGDNGESGIGEGGSAYGSALNWNAHWGRGRPPAVL